VIPAAREAFAAATPAGSPRYFAWLYASVAQRPLLELLLALEQELCASVRAGIDHSVAHARLSWWATEAEQLLAGTARHPLTQALQLACRQQILPTLDLRALIATLQWDLAAAPLPSSAERQYHAAAWSGGLFEPLVQSLVASEDCATQAADLEHFARNAGMALGLVRIFQRMPVDHATSLRTEIAAAAQAAVAELPRTRQPALRPVLVWLGCSYDAAARDEHTSARRWSLLRVNLRAWRHAVRANTRAFRLTEP